MKRTTYFCQILLGFGGICALSIAIAACDPGTESKDEPAPKGTPVQTALPVATPITSVDEALMPDTTVCAIQYVVAASCSQMKLSPSSSASSGTMCIKKADPVVVDKQNLTQNFAKVTAAGQTGWVLRTELGCQRPQQ